MLKESSGISRDREELTSLRRGRLLLFCLVGILGRLIRSGAARERQNKEGGSGQNQSRIIHSGDSSTWRAILLVRVDEAKRGRFAFHKTHGNKVLPTYRGSISRGGLFAFVVAFCHYGLAAFVIKVDRT